ncbi:endonuclease/exonuclease/phosphatase family protein [Algibacter sp. 2305UL17-15]
MVLLLKRKRKVIGNFVALLLFFFCFDSFYQFNFDKETKEPTISILTYNVQGFTSSSNNSTNKKEEIANFVKRIDADIVCFQEFSAIEYKKYRDDYPYWIKSNMDMPNKSVLAIFSKFPIVNNGYLEFPNSNNNTMFVDIDIDGRIYRLYNLHLESYKVDRNSQLNPPNSYNIILKADKNRGIQAQLVKQHMKDFDGEVIIVGDFNSTQYSPVYRVLKGSKKDTFVEAGSGFGGTLKLFKYPFKVDHILVDDKLEVIAHKNFNVNLSDHEPVLAEIKL